jgi:hypothetical protein
MARREACTRSTRSIPAGDVLISAEEEEVKVAKTADQCEEDEDLEE